MSLQVVHGHQGQAPGQGHGLAKGEAHHHPADQARTRRGRHARDLLPTDPGTGHGLGGDAINGLDMGPGGDLRNHATEGRMLLRLQANHGGQHANLARRRQPHDRRSGLVAARLDAKDDQVGHAGR